MQAFPKPKDIKKPRAKPVKMCKMKEHDIQVMIEEYLILRGLTFIRIPDSLFSAIYNSSMSARVKAFISQYLKGISDLTIFHPTAKIKGYPIVPSLEIKTGKGKLSPSQERWKEKVRGVVTYGFDDTKKAIDDFLGTE